MKTIKKTVLVVVLMLGTLVNYANNSEWNNALDAKKVRIVFKGAKKGSQLKIKDNSGLILHQEDVNRAGGFIKYFDFSGLKDGYYTLELEKDYEIIIKSINVKDKKVLFDGDSESKIFKPVIRNKNNRLMITHIALNKEPLKVEIFYNDQIIYSETINEDLLIERVYKLDEEIKGDYRVVLTNNKRNYSKGFQI